jgi:mono/diheme cytochrome c family protein
MKIGWAIWLARIGILVMLCSPQGGLGASSRSARDPRTLARGEYLVEHVLICFNCHSALNYRKRGWPAAQGREGAGRVFLGDAGKPVLVAPNITSDLGTGIGRWTEPQIIKAIREGVNPKGRRLNPIMPYGAYQLLTDDDTEAVVKYVRRIPPVNNPLSENPPYTGTTRSDLPRKSDWHPSRGEYLVTMAGCESCHTPSQGGEPGPNLRFGGGMVLEEKGESAASANLTPSPSGIGYYDQAMFIRTIRQGKIGARRLSPLMPWEYFSGMTDADLIGVFNYLRSIPPVDHHVSNTDKPSYCPRCRFTHGLGASNRPAGADVKK